MAQDLASRRQNRTLRRAFVPVGMSVPEWVDEIAAALRPEQQLWLAVLLDAVQLAGPGTWHKADRAEATRWMADTRTDVGSFVFVCEVLHLSPSAVRRAVASASAQHVTASEWWDQWWGKVQVYLRAA